MKNEEMLDRILNQVYLHEAPGEGHYSRGVLDGAPNIVELAERAGSPDEADRIAGLVKLSAAGFVESQHPRDHGKFARKGDGSGSAAAHAKKAAGHPSQYKQSIDRDEWDGFKAKHGIQDHKQPHPIVAKIKALWKSATGSDPEADARFHKFWDEGDFGHAYLSELSPDGSIIELAFDESQHPRDSHGQFVSKGDVHNIGGVDHEVTAIDGQNVTMQPKGGGAAITMPAKDLPGKSGPGEVERAYAHNTAPAAFALPRGEDGLPISQPVGAGHEYKPKPMPEHWPHGEDAWNGVQQRQAARVSAALNIPDDLQIAEGPEQPGENLKRLTDVDTPEIMRVRAAIEQHQAKVDAAHDAERVAYLAANPDFGGNPNMFHSSMIDTPERNELRKQIALDLYGAGASKKERKAVIISGPPGSGKSSYVKKLGYQDYLEVDSDAAKEQLPEFAGGRGANYVHEESAEIANNVTDHALKAGDNMVWPLVGKSVASMQKVIERLKAAGYDIEVRNVTMPTAHSMESVASRFHKVGRFVPPEYSASVDSVPPKTHEIIKQQYEPTGVRFHQISSEDIFKPGVKLMSEQPTPTDPPMPEVSPFWAAVFDMYDQTADRVFGPQTAAMQRSNPWSEAA